VVDVVSFYLCIFLHQHLAWILGLKPGPAGALRPTQQAFDNAGSLITNAVMSDLPMLSSMLSRLFESSQYVLLHFSLRLE